MRTRRDQQRCRVEFKSASVTACDICKSLVFGFVDADSFRYFDSIYNLQIKFIYKYLRPMVIHCKRLNQILSILWGDIRDLSQILHYPGNDSKAIDQGVSSVTFRFLRHPKGYVWVT